MFLPITGYTCVIIATYSIIDHNQDLLHLALVQYVFDGNEHSVIPQPHGNSKKSDSYVRTMPSTLQKVAGPSLQFVRMS